MIAVITKSGLRETTRAQFDFAGTTIRSSCCKEGVGWVYTLLGSDPATGEEFPICEVRAENVETALKLLTDDALAVKDGIMYVDIRPVDESPGFVPLPLPKPAPPKNTAPVKKVSPGRTLAERGESFADSVASPRG